MRKDIRIALVDDHQMFLDGLSVIIQSLDERYVCDSYLSPRKTLSAIEAGREYDLIISDLVMKEMNGITLLLALQARDCRTPVLIVSGVDRLPPIESVLNGGAMGFVPKSASRAVLSAAIDHGLRRERYIPKEFWELEVTPAGIEPSDANIVPSTNAETPTLSDRQLDVLRLMAEGCSNKRMAEILGISENTIKGHIKLIFRAFDVSRRTACISQARLLGVL